MSLTRRNLLTSGAALAVVGALPRPLAALTDPRWAGFYGNTPRRMSDFSIDDPKLETLVRAAVEAAMAAGASYADARLTLSQSLGVGADYPIPQREETMAVGVRALYKGYWGFSSSPVWNAKESARLGRSATEQAKANVLGGQGRDAELAPMATTTSGQWVMPVKDDPFEMSVDEIFDHVQGISRFIKRLKYFHVSQIGFGFNRQNKAFGNSLGQFITQRLYETHGLIMFGIQDPQKRGAGVTLDCLTPAGLGFEYIRDQPLRKYITEAHEELLRDLELPVQPIEVGRYPMVVDPFSVSKIISQSLGVATEIDRVMGYEANAGGTSYITEPDQMLGTLKMGSPLLTITANRSGVGSVGRVRWDDEGVEPTESTLVDKGVLADLQTNREGSSWIKSYYKRKGMPVASSGCAYAPDAIDTPLVYSADLHLTPDASSTETLDSLRQGIDDGIEWKNASPSMDFQQVTGLLRGGAYKIKKGKRVSRLTNGGVLFRTQELWKNLTHLGSAATVRQFGLGESKGEPQQQGFHSVTTPPALFKEMTFIDVTRKA